MPLTKRFVDFIVNGNFVNDSLLFEHFFAIKVSRDSIVLINATYISRYTRFLGAKAIRQIVISHVVSLKTAT